jgi:ferric-dicitrate binding protein FerR (iron transport regulator)
MNPISEDINALIAKFLTDQLTEAEAAELDGWKLASRENLQEYNDFVALWAQMSSLKMLEPINQLKAYSEIRKKTGIYQSKTRWINWTVQAAAVVVLSLIFSGIYNSLYHTNPTQNFVTNSSTQIYQEITAAYGTQAKVELSDGTKVFLNSGSKLRFPQTFANQQQRNVVLDGEGYFEVTKNKEQPFIVEASQLSIKVTGTKFNVDAYADNSSVSVALVEGSVILQGNTGGQNKDLMQLSPNQVATLNPADQSLSKSVVPDLYKYTAWINGRIVFYGDPIQTVVKKLAKWYNVDIVISDKKLEGYKFTGTFINEPLEQILNILSMTSQMTYTAEPIIKQTDNSMSKRKIILRSKI